MTIIKILTKNTNNNIYLIDGRKTQFGRIGKRHFWSGRGISDVI